MSDTELTPLIEQLSVADGQRRQHAAHELFRIGCACAEFTLREWFADPDFRSLARSGSSLLTVGVAVQPARFSAIRAQFGQPALADAPADQDVIEFELEFAHGVRLDIMTTSDPGASGPVARFLSKFGEGIQQIECDVRDVDRATQILRERFAVEPIYAESRNGANGTRVNFFLTPAGENRRVLIELVETPSRNKQNKSARR